MTLERVHALLDTCTTDTPVFPPTQLYNEGWLLRLALDWFSTHPVLDHPFTFSENTRWFSEALIPSAFLARHKGDRLAETWSHADGVVGHFQIGDKNKGGLSLLRDATQFVVLEAKLFSGLSAGVTYATYFDQAARNVACIAEVLCRANRHPSAMKQLGFYVIAPQAQIEKGSFTKQLSQESIRDKVAKRVEAYADSEDAGCKNEWHRTWFQPLLSSIKIGVISWEAIIATVQESDKVSAEGLAEFYEKAIEFNGKSVAPA